MLDKLQTIETRYDELMALVSDAAVQADPNQYRTHAKALSEIQPIVDQFREYKTVLAEITETQELAESGDADMREMAEQAGRAGDDVGLALRVLVDLREEPDLAGAEKRGAVLGPAERVSEIGNTQLIGKILLTDYLLPFQAMGVLLFVGVIGAVVLARRRAG